MASLAEHSFPVTQIFAIQIALRACLAHFSEAIWIVCLYTLRKAARSQVRDGVNTVMTAGVDTTMIDGVNTVNHGDHWQSCDRPTKADPRLLYPVACPRFPHTNNTQLAAAVAVGKWETPRAFSKQAKPASLCAVHFRQFEGASPLSNLMEVKD